jgi:hypothetical protein
MLDNKFVRAGAFFAVAFGVPVVLGAVFGGLYRAVRIGVVTGVVFAVVSQFFEPSVSALE